MNLAGTVRLTPIQTTTFPKEKSLQHTMAAATRKICLPGWKTQAGSLTAVSPSSHTNLLHGLADPDLAAIFFPIKEAKLGQLNCNQLK